MGQGRTWVGVLFLVVGGCTIVNNYGPKEVVPGKVAHVAARLQDGLSDAGIAVMSKQTDGEFRLAGKSKAGTAFCLHLHEKKGLDGTNTVVRMVWDLGGDEELWKLVLQLLNAPLANESDGPDSPAVGSLSSSRRDRATGTTP